MLNRRVLLQNGALSLFGLGITPAWLTRAVGAPSATGGKKILVVVFQRGAADGLNMVVPYGEKAYYQSRPNLALAQPGKEKGVLDLDGFFGLHPALAPLSPIFADKKLAFVHASGSPAYTRSHFDAQDYMESGTPGVKSTRDGWLNRALPEDAKASPVQAVGLGPVLPRALAGSRSAVALNSVREFQVRDHMAAQEYERRYGKSVDAALQEASKETFAAIEILESVRRSGYQPANGVQYPKGKLGRSMEQIAQLIKGNVGLEVAFADMGGWDHHVNQELLLDRQLKEFGAALAAFYQDLGPRMEQVLLVTMSEFGRTVRENGTRGTDHGHANVMMLMGANVSGGKVHGRWPGLERDQLHEGRDLAVTTDFREVLGAVLQAHRGQTDLARVFPGYSYQGAMRRLLV